MEHTARHTADFFGIVTDRKELGHHHTRRKVMRMQYEWLHWGTGTPDHGSIQD